MLGWPGILVGGAGVGVLTGALAGEPRKHSCAAVWPPGRQMAMVALHDRAGPRGLASATVLAAPQGCGGELRLAVRRGSLVPGARAVVVGTFRAPTVLRVEHVRVLDGPRSARYALRDALARRIERLYGARAPFVDALILGRRDDLDPGWRRVFADAGIAHLLSISGLHVGIVAAWTLLLARLVVSPPRASLLTAVAVWAYVGLLGFPAPAVRSAAFVSLYAVAKIRQRRPPPDAVLAAAVVVVLALDPLAASDLGAWLSVAATWGTAFALKQLGPEQRRQPVVSLLAASLGATLATAPITAFAFGTVAPVGLLTNLVAVPLGGVAVPGVFASLALGGPLAAGSGLALAAVERAAEIAAMLPGGQVRGAPGVGFALPWAAGLGAAVWVCRRRPKLGALRLRTAAVLAAGAWAGVIIPALSARRGTKELRIFLLDVGQGDAIAVRTPRGRWLLIDAGPRTPAVDAGRSVVLPFLRREGARRVDLVMASHGHDDHLGGLPAVVDALLPELVLEPGQPLGTPRYLDFLRAVDGAGVTWRAARAGDTVRLDSVELAVLHPSQPWLTTHLDPNENSVVVRLTYGELNAVLTGDAGLPAESLLAEHAEGAEVLKVGHHGSAGATGSAWLDALRPRVALISAGAGNRYGHPDPGVLQRLAARGIDVYRTDRGGTVTIRTDGRYFEVVQGVSGSWLEGVRCLVQTSLPSRASSWRRSACIPRRPASYPTSSTTSPSRPRSSRATSGGRDW
jgi:competence protein ComEC